MVTKFRKLAFVGAGLAPVASFAEGYTVPAGVTTAISDAEAAATGLANSAIPAVAAIGMAFVGVALVWLLIKTIRRAAK